MAIQIQPLPLADASYSEDGEDFFRREVERYLLLLSAGISGATSLVGTEASLASKRENFVSPPVA